MFIHEHMYQILNLVHVLTVKKKLRHIKKFYIDYNFEYKINSSINV